LGFDESKGRVDAFANRLQKAMDIRGMKKAELSRQTGISQQRIGQYVRGGYEAKQSAVYVIAKTLKVDPAWLMGYDLPMEPPAGIHGHNMADKYLKLALFGNANVNDALLQDIKDMAKIHLELSKKRRGARRR
jgi:transcriptional regulator with XRE-family HTH domain